MEDRKKALTDMMSADEKSGLYMEKQTTVEWLVEEINKLTGLTIQMDEPIIEQAKEMEKQQMLEVSKAGCFGTFEFEQYYNETFKSE
jgi:hypothetical protein